MNDQSPPPRPSNPPPTVDAGPREGPGTDAGFLDSGVYDAGNTRPPDAGLPPRPPDAGTVPAQPTWATHVEPIMRRRCGTCHNSPPIVGAPMSIVRHSDVMAPSPSDPRRAVHELIVERIQPNIRRGLMPPNDPMPASEIAIIEAWSAAGAP